MAHLGISISSSYDKKIKSISFTIINLLIRLFIISIKLSFSTTAQNKCKKKTFQEREREKGRKRNVVVIFLSDRRERKRCSFEVIKVENFPDPLQQQRPDLPRLLQQVHAQQLPPGAAMGPHPGIPGLPGLGPGAGLPVPTSASAALLGLGIPPGAAATAGGTAAHPLSMLTKPDIHRQADDLKHNGGKRLVHFFSEIGRVSSGINKVNL